MLSDEERMAIEHLKNYPINWLIETVNESAIKIVLNLIEKQQKEIEELKKYEKYYEEMEEVNKKFIAVDKIKAKIEEYKKQQKEEPDAYLCIKVLRSLLEKE